MSAALGCPSALGAALDSGYGTWGDARVVVGDITNASGTEALLREKGVQVDILEDPLGIELYSRFRTGNPELDLEDWKGLSATRKP